MTVARYYSIRIDYVYYLVYITLCGTIFDS
nr:MAG TPA: hypothetical protein [Caudoviricetes sp.]